jgi:Protein tyrosine and serine/threonine kinase
MRLDKLKLYRAFMFVAGMTNSEVLTQLERGYRHPKPPNSEDEMYDIMLQCWRKVAEERPTFEYLFDTMNSYHIAVERQYADTS